MAVPNHTKSIEAKVDIRVQFNEVDAMGIVWHGHYIKYFETARTALLHKIGYDYFEMKKSGYAWPVIEARCKYIKPLTYDTTVTIQAKLTEYENRLKITYMGFDALGNRVCKGYTIQVAVEMPSQEMCFESPDILLRCIREYQNA